MSSENSAFDFNIGDVMTALSVQRDIFTSEADFQFALAWKIKQLYPEFDIRLEETLDIGDDKHDFIHVDIIIHKDNSRIIPIELKYCTKSVSVENLDGFVLKDQGAENNRRYDFIKDIQRVESIRNKHREDGAFICGYCIFLTNSERYWNRTKNWESRMDAQFRIHEDNGHRIYGGEKKWQGKDSVGTRKGREASLKTDSYEIKWKKYGETALKYLSIMVV